MNAYVRTFDSGATRDLDQSKLDYEGFLSPLVMRRYAQYMHKHRIQPDGDMRDSDNWQKGIPLPVYMKSAWRHFFDVWAEHRGFQTDAGIEENICALIFNMQGYLHELQKAKLQPSTSALDLPKGSPDALVDELIHPLSTAGED